MARERCEQKLHMPPHFDNFLLFLPQSSQPESQPVEQLSHFLERPSNFGNLLFFPHDVQPSLIIPSEQPPVEHEPVAQPLSQEVQPRLPHMEPVAQPVVESIAVNSRLYASPR